MTEQLIEKFENDVAKRKRLMRFLLVLDQMGNVVFLNGMVQGLVLWTLILGIA